MKIGFEASGGASASPYALQEATADGFDATEAGFHQEHDADGRHTVPLQELTVAGDVVVGGSTLLGGDVIADGEFDVELTADTHNLAKRDGRAIAEMVIRLQASVGVEWTGLVPPSNANHIRLIENGGNETITMAHNDSGSLAPNRFSLPSARDYLLLSGQIALLKYDPNSEIWRVLAPGGGVKSVQRVVISYTTGATTASAAINAVDLTRSDISFIGELFDSNAGFPTVLNSSVLDNASCTSTLVAIKRRSGTDLGSATIEGTVVVQVVEYP